MLFFLFKKKTAYEMRISDWSSDVCSSDLRAARRRPCRDAARGGRTRRRGGGCGGQRRDRRHGGDIPQLSARPFGAGADEGGRRPRGPGSAPRRRAGGDGGPRSEEHTSELQSLMRISYDVFCLKKKKTKLLSRHYKK